MVESAFALWQKKAVEDPDLVADLAQLTDKEEIYDRFYRELEFGTGGLRGVLGAGANRMNLYTVRKATQGLAEYIKEQPLSQKVAIAYDSRNKSQLFAQEAARVLIANGIEAWLYPRLMPTPALSYAVRRLECGAGICITASHNPAKYNGYKVYGRDGCQITTETAQAIYDKIRQVDPFTVRVGEAEQIRTIPEEVVEDYLREVLALRMPHDASGELKLVYTPLNGAGLECVTRALELAGYREIAIVPQQREPDGDFPTCPYPNPEERSALKLGLELCRETGGDLLLATDPDCDRVGIVVRDGEECSLLNGNEVGVLLLDYICKCLKSENKMPRNPVAIKTIVTTGMTDKVAAAHGVQIINTLTGFKFIGEQIGVLEQAEEADRYLFGFEESYGYLSGVHVRDKDAVNASLLICDMAAWYKAQGKTLLQAMEDLYQQYGYCLTALDSFTFEGENGQKTMEAKMTGLRENPPATLCGSAVSACRDYLWRPGESPRSLPSSNVLQFDLADDTLLTVRPSGTEPKLKVYYQVTGATRAAAQDLLADKRGSLKALLLG